MKKTLIAMTIALGLISTSVTAAPQDTSRETLEKMAWQQIKDKPEKTVYYAKDADGVWIKSVDKKDSETEYKHYRTDCGTQSDVVKDAEISFEKDGTIEREKKNKTVQKTRRADRIRSLICGK